MRVLLFHHLIAGGPCIKTFETRPEPVFNFISNIKTETVFCGKRLYCSVATKMLSCIGIGISHIKTPFIYPQSDICFSPLRNDITRRIYKRIILQYQRVADMSIKKQLVDTDGQLTKHFPEIDIPVKVCRLFCLCTGNV